MKSFHALVLMLVCALVAPSIYAADAASPVPAVRVFVTHEVTDYAVWRKAYDAFAPTQKKLGVTHQSVYQSVDNPNMVVVEHDFASVEKAKTFLDSAELKGAMEKAGVKGAPHILVTTPGKK